jgi:hypothetical protein
VDESDEDDEPGRLTKEGEKMKKLILHREKNAAYESDDERNPYASSVSAGSSAPRMSCHVAPRRRRKKKKKNHLHLQLRPSLQSSHRHNKYPPAQALKRQRQEVPSSGRNLHRRLVHGPHHQYQPVWAATRW